jgi:hypothetical protein
MKPIEGDEGQETDYNTSDPEVPIVLHNLPTHADDVHHQHKQNRAEHYTGIAFHWVRLFLGYIWREALWNKAFWTFAATVVMAVATAIYAVYAGRQWSAINKQLPELRTSAEAARDAARAADASAKIAQQQLEMSERPWVVTQYAPNAPLEFMADGSATFAVLGKITNIGHSVALYVHDTPLITLEENSVAMLHPTDTQSDVCDRIRDMGERFPDLAHHGDTLFPGDSAYENMPLRFTKDQIAKARLGKTDTFWGLVIIGCVDYTFSFSPKHHQTGYVYEMVRPAPPIVPLRGDIVQGGTLPIKIGETLQPNQLIVRRSIFGGFYAD